MAIVIWTCFGSDLLRRLFLYLCYLSQYTVRPPMPSKEMRSIVTQVSKLWDSLSSVFPDQQLQVGSKIVFVWYRSKSFLSHYISSDCTNFMLFYTISGAPLAVIGSYFSSYYQLLNSY